MAQLLDTIVNGDLEIIGRAHQTNEPTLPEHMVNKAYLDRVTTCKEGRLAPIGGNYNSSGAWVKFTTNDYSVELEKGTYQIIMSCVFEGHGTGFITTRVMMNNTEIDADGSGFKKTRQTSPCDSVRTVSTNATFLLEIDMDGNYSFRPEAFGTASWTGTRATIAIIRIR